MGLRDSAPRLAPVAITIEVGVGLGRPADHGSAPGTDDRTTEPPLIGRIGIASRKRQADGEDRKFPAHADCLLRSGAFLPDSAQADWAQHRGRHRHNPLPHHRRHHRRRRRFAAPSGTASAGASHAAIGFGSDPTRSRRGWRRRAPAALMSSSAASASPKTAALVEAHAPCRPARLGRRPPRYCQARSLISASATLPPCRRSIPTGGPSTASAR